MNERLILERERRGRIWFFPCPSPRPRGRDRARARPKPRAVPPPFAPTMPSPRRDTRDAPRAREIRAPPGRIGARERFGREKRIEKTARSSSKGRAHLRSSPAPPKTFPIAWRSSCLSNAPASAFEAPGAIARGRGTDAMATVAVGLYGWIASPRVAEAERPLPRACNASANAPMRVFRSSGDGRARSCRRTLRCAFLVAGASRRVWTSRARGSLCARGLARAAFAQPTTRPRFVVVRRIIPGVAASPV